MNAAPAVFFSYSRTDDETERARLSGIRKRLEKELRFLSGNEAWEVFQDVEDIEIGQQWRQRLSEGVAGSTFFVPVLTPTYFERPICREELMQFVQREKELRRDDLIIPILYVDVPILNQPDDTERGMLARNIAARQRDDWRDLRTFNLDSAKVRRRITQLANSILSAHTRGAAQPIQRDSSAADLTTSRSEDDWLEELTSRHALFAALLAEANGSGITTALLEAIVASDIPAIDLEAFFQIMARRSYGKTRYAIAIGALQLGDSRECARTVVEFCLQPGNLAADWRDDLAHAIAGVSNAPSTVKWCHTLLTRDIKLDPQYYFFLSRHAAEVAQHCPSDMAAYLLVPDRGPAAFNLDSFTVAVRISSKPKPFLTRMTEWVRDGWFDGNRSRQSEGCETPTDLYRYLNILLENADDRKRFNEVFQVTHDRVYRLIKQRSGFEIGFDHVAAMIIEKYKGAQSLEFDLLHRIYEVPSEYSDSWQILEAGFAALIKYLASPEHPAASTELHEVSMNLFSRRRDSWAQPSQER
ncbi:MAG TPA: toll/interleukin-1 receptor domain-containing protein [Chthoniobacterales bacterium]|nr:toll/interleukin-1 receptor domain-containing protein [Chthoniobacterales bacterium]